MMALHFTPPLDASIARYMMSRGHISPPSRLRRYSRMPVISYIYHCNGSMPCRARGSHAPASQYPGIGISHRRKYGLSMIYVAPSLTSSILRSRKQALLIFLFYCTATAHGSFGASTRYYVEGARMPPPYFRRAGASATHFARRISSRFSRRRLPHCRYRSIHDLSGTAKVTAVA